MARNLLKSGEQWLASRQRRHASETVTYTIASDAELSIRAVRGRTELSVEDGSGLQLAVNQEDWLIHADELVFDSAQRKPKPGDTVTDESGVVYEVSAPGPGMDCWEWAEPTQIRYRIHTKQIPSS